MTESTDLVSSEALFPSKGSNAASTSKKEESARDVHGIKVIAALIDFGRTRKLSLNSVVHRCQCCSLYDISFRLGYNAGLFDISLLSPKFPRQLAEISYIIYQVANIQPSIVHRLGEISKLPWVGTSFALGAVATMLCW